MKPQDEVSLLIYDEPSASLDPQAEYGASQPVVPFKPPRRI